MESKSPQTPPEPVVIKNDGGQVILRISLLFTMYFANGFDLDVRQRVGQCFDFYRSLVATNMRWALATAT
jgi:hypothetical protein